MVPPMKLVIQTLVLLLNLSLWPQKYRQILTGNFGYLKKFLSSSHSAPHCLLDSGTVPVNHTLAVAGCEECHVIHTIASLEDMNVRKQKKEF
jgi:hypothetical protein